MALVLPKLSLGVSVEDSKAARLQRHQARFRDRGGIFVPAPTNALVDILLAKSVTGESPSKPRPSSRDVQPVASTSHVSSAAPKSKSKAKPTAKVKATAKPKASKRKPPAKSRATPARGSTHDEDPKLEVDDDDMQDKPPVAQQIADIINAAKRPSNALLAHPTTIISHPKPAPVKSHTKALSSTSESAAKPRSTAPSKPKPSANPEPKSTAKALFVIAEVDEEEDGIGATDAGAGKVKAVAMEELMGTAEVGTAEVVAEGAHAAIGPKPVGDDQPVKKRGGKKTEAKGSRKGREGLMGKRARKAEVGDVGEAYAAPARKHARGRAIEDSAPEQLPPPPERPGAAADDVRTLKLDLPIVEDGEHAPSLSKTAHKPRSHPVAVDEEHDAPDARVLPAKKRGRKEAVDADPLPAKRHALKAPQMPADWDDERDAPKKRPRKAGGAAGEAPARKPRPLDDEDGVENEPEPPKKKRPRAVPPHAVDVSPIQHPRSLAIIEEEEPEERPPPAKKKVRKAHEAHEKKPHSLAAVVEDGEGEVKRQPPAMKRVRKLETDIVNKPRADEECKDAERSPPAAKKRTRKPDAADNQKPGSRAEEADVPPLTKKHARKAEKVAVDDAPVPKHLARAVSVGEDTPAELSPATKKRARAAPLSAADDDRDDDAETRPAKKRALAFRPATKRDPDMPPTDFMKPVPTTKSKTKTKSNDTDDEHPVVTRGKENVVQKVAREAAKVPAIKPIPSPTKPPPPPSKSKPKPKPPARRAAAAEEDSDADPIDFLS